MATHEEQFEQVVSILRIAHGELRQLEQQGFDERVRENPALIGEYLIKLRLNCSMLFAFINAYLEILSTAVRETAEKRQKIYEQQLALKKSENASKNHSTEMTRVDEANIKVLEYKIQSIKNEYERYNSICMALQSRMREFDTERRVG